MGGVPGSDATGGSLQLDELIEEHGEALLFDLQSIGVDLRDLWRPGTRVTPRYVLWLVGQLPQSSAFAASMRGGAEFRPWTTDTYLLAAVVNILAAANRQRAGKRGGKPVVKPPQAQRARPARVLSVAQLAARQKSANN